MCWGVRCVVACAVCGGVCGVWWRVLWACAWGVCGAGRVCCGVWGACGVCAVRGGGKVSLAALLSGYLGKSGHLPRYFFVDDQA